MSTTAKEQPDDTKEPSGASTRPAPKVVHLTEEERVGRGKSAREQTPRTSHAELETDGRDPVAIVDADSAARVPELVPIRYGRMLVSAFTFYRGAASLMAHDLASTPRTGLNAQLCGDAHLLELRRLRVAFARPRLRPERLRRDAAGPVRVGRQAPRGEHRDRRPRPGVRRQDPSRERARLGARRTARDAVVRCDGQPRRLVLTARRHTAARPGSPPRSRSSRSRPSSGPRRRLRRRTA